MDEDDSGDDIFITQNMFRDVNIDTQDAGDAADSLLNLFNDLFTPGEPVELLDFSNQKDNSSICLLVDEGEFVGDFPEVNITYYWYFKLSCKFSIVVMFLVGIFIFNIFSIVGYC